jgi:hypothetical protein
MKCRPSFGGLIVKDMLVSARAAAAGASVDAAVASAAGDVENFRALADNTIGVVFYSTPHRGALLTKYMDTVPFTRRTPVVDDLLPDAPQLLGQCVVRALLM